MPEALYRKYRPQVFADVVGQEPIERTLRNALEQDKVSHAYLFCGPRGTGKTTTARLLAKALLCEDGPTAQPDGTCEECQLIADGVHPDVYELDAASRTGVENVREEIISRVSFAPTRGRSKVYIIDEVHMLSTAAFNALLKTLEEPPDHVVFILCTTDPQKVPETIHSRCQRFDFRRIAPEAIVTRLGAICVEENVEFEGEALDLIAQRAEGGLRNALTSLEQIIAFENGRITLEGAERLLGSIDSSDLSEVMALIGQRDIAGSFRWIADYVETGADLAQFVRDMAEHVRNLYILILSGDDAVLEISEPARRTLVQEQQWFGPDRASRLLGVLGDLIAELKTSSNPRLSFEIALTRMVRPDSDLTLEAVAERVEALEQGSLTGSRVLTETTVASSPGPSPSSSPVAEASEGRTAERSDDETAKAEVAPSPVEVQAAPIPQEGDLANPAAFQRLWQAVMAEVKRKKQAYAVLFLNTKASFDEADGSIHVLFPAEAAFAFKAVQGPDVQEALDEAIQGSFGKAIPFFFDQDKGSSAASSTGEQPMAKPEPAPASTPEPDPEPAPEPEPEPEPTSVPEPEMVSAPTPMPESESVPVEVYEAELALAPEAEPMVAAEPAPESEPEAADASDEGSPDVPADVQSLLESGFGSGIIFEEVDE